MDYSTNQTGSAIVVEVDGIHVSQTSLFLTIITIIGASLVYDSGDFFFEDGIYTNLRWFRTSPLFAISDMLVLFHEIFVKYRTHYGDTAIFQETVFLALGRRFLAAQPSLNSSACKQDSSDLGFDRFMSETTKDSNWSRRLVPVFSIIQFVKLLSFQGVAIWIKVLAGGFVLTTILNHALLSLASNYLFDSQTSQMLQEKEKPESYKSFRFTLLRSNIIDPATHLRDKIHFYAIFLSQLLPILIFTVTVHREYCLFWYQMLDNLFIIGPIMLKGMVEALTKPDARICLMIFMRCFSILFFLIMPFIYLGFIIIMVMMGVQNFAAHLFSIYLMLGGIWVLVFAKTNGRPSFITQALTLILQVGYAAFFIWLTQIDLQVVLIMFDFLPPIVFLLDWKSVRSKDMCPCFVAVFGLQMLVFVMGYVYWGYEPLTTARPEWTVLLG